MACLIFTSRHDKVVYTNTLSCSHLPFVGRTKVNSASRRLRGDPAMAHSEMVHSEVPEMFRSSPEQETTRCRPAGSLPTSSDCSEPPPLVGGLKRDEQCTGNERRHHDLRT
jgi:hypothetical protein